VRAARARLAINPATPVVALATAHPAKFPAAIERAIGRRIELPPRLAPILTAPERFSRLENDESRIKVFITDHARAMRNSTRA
jgi:threonine synthase